MPSPCGQSQKHVLWHGKGGEETSLLPLDPSFPTRRASEPPSPRKKPTYCNLKVDGFVTNLPVDHGSFQEGSKKKELLHLSSAVLQDKSQRSWFGSARGTLSPGQRGSLSGPSEHSHISSVWILRRPWSFVSFSLTHVRGRCLPELGL